MFCPNCKDEYDEGIEICAECGIPLVHDLEDETRKEISLEDETREEITPENVSGHQAYCPFCHIEFGSETEICTHCGSTLLYKHDVRRQPVNDSTGHHKTKNKITDPYSINLDITLKEVSLMRGYLRSNGILCKIIKHKTGNIRGLGASGFAELVINKEDREIVESLLADLKNDSHADFGDEYPGSDDQYPVDNKPIE